MKHMHSILLILLIFAAIAMPQERRIKAGDGIEIVVYGHQELSRIVTVSPQGTIDFPFMQNLPVDGLTIDKLREIIVAQLSRYLEEYPVVTLNFAKSSTIAINVMGMVKQPGILQLPLNTHLQAAIAAAGGLAPGARANEVALMRSEAGKPTTTKYDLEKFLLEGDLRQNPVLSEGDVLLITGSEISGSVKVLGEVRAPGIFDEFTGATVMDMLMRAGGPTKDGNIKKLRYISPARKKQAEYRINIEEYLAASSSYPMPVVQAGDIIYVPRKTNYWSFILGTARDASTIALAVWYISRFND